MRLTSNQLFSMLTE